MRQKIFASLECHKAILQLLSNGLLIFETYSGYFTNQSKLVRKTTLDVSAKIIDIFRASHQILSLFCRNCKEHQKILTNSINLIIQNKDYNVNQIDLIYEIVNHNPQLAQQMSESIWEYFCKMIVDHGRKAIFLKVFKTGVSYENFDNSPMKNKILLFILNDEYIDILNVINVN